MYVTAQAARQSGLQVLWPGQGGREKTLHDCTTPWLGKGRSGSVGWAGLKTLLTSVPQGQFNIYM